ncbi:hypothetical protein [Lactococcus muris]|uniref:hypothetical protein n=1 Tax=Lactococcus muris TaxID=2941330 RepID=UPI002301026F
MKNIGYGGKQRVKKKHFKKTVTSLVTTTVLFSSLVPSVVGVAQSQVIPEVTEEVTQVNETSLNLGKKSFEDFLLRKGIHDIKEISQEDGEKLLDEYANLLDRQRLAPVAAAAAVASLIWAGINIGKSFYSAGRYAAMQALSRRWTTRTAYKRNSKPYWFTISTISFWAALGFDDFMYGR